jgi:hypothetical protein
MGRSEGGGSSWLTRRGSHIPATLIHGLHDVSSPLDTACELPGAGDLPASAAHRAGGVGEQLPGARASSLRAIAVVAILLPRRRAMAW